MISATPSRLPHLLSATTLLLVFGLLLSLLEIAHNPRRPPSYMPGATRASDSAAGWGTHAPTPARIVFESQLDALAAALDTLARTPDPRSFSRARIAYKRAESLLQTYSPTTTHALNGPLENDDGDAPPLPLGSPAAFQRILTSLATRPSGAARDSIRATARTMQSAIVHLRAQTHFLDVGELPVLESSRTELARITTLGLAGFDLDEPSNAVPEAAAALEGVRAVIDAEAASSQAASQGALTVSRESWIRISLSLRSASEYLAAHPDFEQLDRLALFTRYLNPAARAIASARAPLLAHAYAQRRVWRAESATVFDRGALDPAAFAPDYAPPASPSLIALGARLFSDTRLSGEGDRSCATCHEPSRAFTDGRARPVLIAGARGGAAVRNTPTLLEVAYQPLYFADERAASLEDQIGAVLASHAEMGGSAELAATHIARDSAMRSLFARALAGRSDSVPSGRAVRIALAAYLRSLGTFDSRFDRAVRGDTAALTSEERRGFTLFMGKARCGTCHFAPLFSGVMPPELTSSEPEIIGVPARATLHHATLDPDSGRAAVDHIPEHLYAFKVPTLRNIALTAPYMHNGAYATLGAVLDFYQHGGGAGLGAHVPRSTLSPASLHLSVSDRSAIEAFLRALTDSQATLQPKTVAAR